MAKFKFYQDKEVKTWIRDYFNVEAETLEEAIEYVKNMGCTFDKDECKKGTKVEFYERDVDLMLNTIVEADAYGESGRYSIFSCDLDAINEDSEVVRK